MLRARLLFDGGYYHQSKDVLDKMNVHQLSSDEQLEQTYRYARIAHKLYQWNTAKEKYRETIEKGSNSVLYYSGNAALKIGEIFEVQDSIEKAKKYYNLCLQLNFKEYRNSIRGKAKESLARVQQR